MNTFRSITAILSASEIALGSYLHLARIPFTGQLLSLNQCFWLNVSKKWSPDDSSLKISLQVAAIKALSPYGKRITPMLGIATQGLLFESGTFLFGSKLPGRLLGSVFMSLWSIVQPLIIYCLFLGFSLTNVLNFLHEKISINIYTGLIILLLTKISAAVFVCMLTTFLPFEKVMRYGSWIQKLEERLKPSFTAKSRWKKILFSPFTISLTMICTYLYFTSSSMEIFLRGSLFYICWMGAILYLSDLLVTKWGSQWLAKIKKIKA